MQQQIEHSPELRAEFRRVLSSQHTAPELRAEFTRVQSSRHTAPELRAEFRGVQSSRHSSSGFPDGSAGKNPPAMQETQKTWGSIPGSGRSPGEGNETCSSILAGESHGWRSLAADLHTTEHADIPEVSGQPTPGSHQRRGPGDR